MTDGMTARAGKVLAVAALALAVAACGNRVELQPRAGETLPVAPRGQVARPTASELLSRPPQAAPERSVELRRRSEEREDDPFDLPPIDPGRRHSIEPATPRVCGDVAARDHADPAVLACREVPAAGVTAPG